MLTAEMTYVEWNEKYPLPPSDMSFGEWFTSGLILFMREHEWPSDPIYSQQS